MSPDDYQRLAMVPASKTNLRDLNTWISLAETFEEQDNRASILMAALGLTGESGEVADILKKVVFHGHDLDKAKLKAELGDVLWYVARLASALDLSLSDIMQHNIDKLQARYPEGFNSEASRNRK